MGWGHALVLAIGGILIAAGVIAFLKAEKRDRDFISNRELNAHKVTPAIPFAMRDHK